MADDITKKLDELRRRATEHLHEARAIVAQMNTVELLFELPETKLLDLETAGVGDASVPLSVVLGPSAETRNQAQPHKRRASTSIRPDEYFGDEPMDAAKKFMRGVGHAVPFDEIADAVQKGGAAVKGSDWRERLELSLKRSPYQVIMVADKTYGLAEFYTDEQMKRFRGLRRSEPDTASKKKAKTKGKRKAKLATRKPKLTTPARESGPATPRQRPPSDDDVAEPVH